jgi:hypothetical protein
LQSLTPALASCTLEGGSFMRGKQQALFAKPLSEIKRIDVVCALDEMIIA